MFRRLLKIFINTELVQVHFSYELISLITASAVLNFFFFLDDFRITLKSEWDTGITLFSLLHLMQANLLAYTWMPFLPRIIAATFKLLQKGDHKPPPFSHTLQLSGEFSLGSGFLFSWEFTVLYLFLPVCISLH